MGLRPISSYTISNGLPTTQFIEIDGIAQMFPNLQSAIAEIQSETWRRLILAVEITALPLS